LIWSVVSLLKSGGLVWAPLVACETEMGAGMHGCLKLMPARAANRFPRDLKTIDRRAIQHLPIVALNLIPAAPNTPPWTSTVRAFDTHLAPAEATSALYAIYHGLLRKTPRAFNYRKWPQQLRSAQTSTDHQLKTTLMSPAASQVPSSPTIPRRRTTTMKMRIYRRKPADRTG
jgi:hypothetical protein